MLKTLALLTSLFIHHFCFSQCQVLVWSDEFNGTGLPDSRYWGYDLGSGGWGNQEIQNYTNNVNNVRQENGRLIIDAIKSGSNWTSARVKTQNKKSFKYGKIVFRAKLPTGVGTWPALWMLGENISTVGWPACGEIDVMEHVGRNQNVIQAALHTPSSYGDTQNKKSTIINTASTEFHEYSVLWNAEKLIFAVDDIPFYTYNPAVKTSLTWPFNANHFLIMNIAIGGTFGGPVDPLLNSARMEIDYVRVYEERPLPTIAGAKFVFEDQQNIQYSAPDYGPGAIYTWSVPEGSSIVSGQGTKNIVVNWGKSNGAISLTVSGEAICTNYTTSESISIIFEPTGLKYVANDFSDATLSGWTKTSNGIILQSVNNNLNVTYNVPPLKYLQYEIPNAVNLKNYGILKLPISIPTTASISNLIITLLDGDENETTATQFETGIGKNDGKTYIYSYDFTNKWALNNPKVNENAIKYFRIYLPPGDGAFQIGPIEFHSNIQVPQPPINLSATISGKGKVLLNWSDPTNATSFNVYRSDNSDAPFIKIKTEIKTSEVPYTVTPTETINYYKISGLNLKGESALSPDVEIIADITGVNFESKNPVSVYPNPYNGRFFIQTNGKQINSLKIYSDTGAEQEFNLTKDNSLLIIDLNSKPGNYYIIINQENKVVVVKIYSNTK